MWSEKRDTSIATGNQFRYPESFLVLFWPPKLQGMHDQVGRKANRFLRDDRSMTRIRVTLEADNADPIFARGVEQTSESFATAVPEEATILHFALRETSVLP